MATDPNNPGASGILPDEIYFQKPYVDQMVTPYMEKICYFNRLVQALNIASPKFTYAQRNFTVDQQLQKAIQGRPLPEGETTPFNEIKVQRSERKAGRTYGIGYKYRMSRDDVLEVNNGNEDAINDYNWVLFSMGIGIAKDTDYAILNTFKNGATAPTYDMSKSKVWNDPDATPIKDMTQMGWAYQDETFINELNDFFMERSSVHALLDYCDSKDIEWTKNGSDYQIGKTPVRNQTVHDVGSSLDAGESINLDLRPGMYMGASFYRCHDPKFSVQKANSQDANDMSDLQINIVDMQTKPYDRIIEVWTNLGAAVKVGRAIQYQKGLMPAV